MSNQKDDMLRRIKNDTLAHLEHDFETSKSTPKDADWCREGWEPDNILDIVKKRYPPNRYVMKVERRQPDGKWNRIVLKEKG